MAGRPTKYTSNACKVALEYLGKGHSKEALAGALEVHRDTLYEWCKKYPEFSDTIKRGEAMSLLHWEEVGLDGMMGKIKGFNASIWIFTMKSRFGWSDNPQPKYKEELLDEQPEIKKEDMVRLVAKYGKILSYSQDPEIANIIKKYSN